MRPAGGTLKLAGEEFFLHARAEGRWIVAGLDLGGMNRRGKILRRRFGRWHGATSGAPVGASRKSGRREEESATSRNGSISRAVLGLVGVERRARPAATRATCDGGAAWPCCERAARRRRAGTCLSELARRPDSSTVTGTRGHQFHHSGAGTGFLYFYASGIVKGTASAVRPLQVFGDLTLRGHYRSTQELVL